MHQCLRAPISAHLRILFSNCSSPQEAPGRLLRSRMDRHRHVNCLQLDFQSLLGYDYQAWWPTRPHRKRITAQGSKEQGEPKSRQGQG